MTSLKIAQLVSTVTLATLLLTSVLPCAARAATTLAHYEYECITDNGCPHSATTATEANFGIEVFPGRVDFQGYAAGETEDVTVPIDDFLVDFLTSGSLSAPEPMEFLQVMVGAGGGGQSVDKSDLQMGIMRNGPGTRVDAGYDVPLANGIDLDGTAVLTDVRFQLFQLEIFNSDQLAGSTMRSHYRYEFIGNRIPEPATAVLLGISAGVLVIFRHSRRR
ncbi:MAG: PEP-CTERM sorting domain-containing protein [Aeoliella sp.]